MHVETHILSGWCLGNLLPLTPRDRGLCMVAAALPDLDGLGILGGMEWYWRFHHIVAHNLLFILLATIALTLISRRKWLVLPLSAALLHLHLLMDYWGSGPGWHICYWWPFLSLRENTWINPNAWPFSSWQNQATAGLFIAWMLAIIYLKGRTPLEALMPSLDRQLAHLFGWPMPTVPVKPASNQ